MRVSDGTPGERTDDHPDVPGDEQRQTGGPERQPASSRVGLGQRERDRLVDQQMATDQATSPTPAKLFPDGREPVGEVMLALVGHPDARAALSTVLLRTA